VASGVRVEVDQRKAALARVDVADVAQTLAMALQGASVSTLHVADEPKPVAIVVRFAPAYRRDVATLGTIAIPTRSGGAVPLSSVTTVTAAPVGDRLDRDDFADVTYVGAEMAGRSSTYAVIDAMLALAKTPLPAGYRVDWGGEWSLTLTVFADLGRAMLLAFVLIYFVLVARFHSFRIPLVVLAAVPLAFIGVMPGFALLAPHGIYFSATAMIGLIALIGIVVRNSIILIEFIEDKRAEGVALRDALVEAAGARTRPIFLTAAAGVLSSVVIAADPVWSGLAWALVFGMTASAVLSVIAVPLLYARMAPAPAQPAELTEATEVHPAVRTIIHFPELDGATMESTTLPRVLAGEVVELDAEIYRGIGDGVDAVAHLHGPFRAEHATVAFTGAVGQLETRQELTLRSVGEAPVWRELEPTS
jgi:multidrug efflux pump subunit AcrB